MSFRQCNNQQRHHDVTSLSMSTPHRTSRLIITDLFTGFYLNVTMLRLGMLWQIRLSSVTFMRPPQLVEIFGNVLRHFVP